MRVIVLKKMSKVVLSFDDGRKDNFEIVRPILLDHNLTATFNIATAYVDGSISDSERPCDNPAMSIDDVVNLYNDGFEIAGHGDRHKNIDDDVATGIKKLHDWLNLPIDSLLGFASPNSNLSSEEVIRKRKFYQDNHISYVRIGIVEDKSVVKKVERKTAAYTGSARLYEKAFNASVGMNLNHFVYYSVPVMNKATTEQVICLLNNAVMNKKDCILMFHSILGKEAPFYNNTWSWDKNKFIQLCAWLSKEKTMGILSVEKTMDLVERGKV